MEADMRRVSLAGVLVLAVAVGGAATLGSFADGDVEPAADPAAPPGPTERANPGTSPTGPAPSASPPAASDRQGAIVIWSRDPLPEGFAGSVAGLAGVVTAVEVRADTLGLTGARTADGQVVLDLDGGFRVPVGVAAVDPDAYAGFVTDDLAATISSLEPGHVLLTETGASLRGVDVGGEIDLVGRPGLEVSAVVPDGTVRRSELLLHPADASAAGLEDDPTVVVRHTADPGAGLERLLAAMEDLVPDHLRARVVDVDDRNASRGGPLVLSLTEVKRHFGEFAFRPRPGVREIDIDPSFRDAQIVTADVPILGPVTCHRGIIDDLRGALQTVVDLGLSGEIDPSRYAGCYYPRRISEGGSRLSRHSWGIALDINVDLSLPDLGPPPHPDVVAAFEANGFRWGGDFLHPDNHHFEWVGDVGEVPAPTDG